MSSSPTRAAIIAVASVLALWGCDDGPQLGRVAPEIAVALDPLAFGEVPLGATKRIAVEVENVGNAPLALTAVDAAAPFGVDAPEAGVIEPGARVTFDVWFRPANDEPQTGTLRIESDDADEPSVTVPLTGLGVAGVLAVAPTAVDFSDTKVGGERSAELVLANSGLDSVEGILYADGFDQPEHFSLTLLPNLAESAPFAVPARAEQVLELIYRPLEPGIHGGRLVFEICGARCGLEVEVAASARESLVRLAPPLVDFGGVGIGETRTEQLRVENGGDEPLEVRTVGITGSADLSVQVTRTLPARLEGGDALGINVEYTPSSAAEARGEVVVETGPVQETVRASVVGRGEGPLFRVEPPAIAFGVEPEPRTYRRPALLVNAGSSDVRVTAVTLAGDPQLRLDALPGLPARLGPGESLTVTVLFSPQDVREHHATLAIETDDVNAARVEVPVSGAMADAYCDLDLSTQRVSFGLLPPMFRRTRTVTVENAGSEPCAVLEGAFRSPVDGAISELRGPWPATLAPGQRVELEFEYAPTVEVDSKASYVMRTDDPVFPERTVSVFGTARGNLDIFARPASVDFGSMRVGCAPAMQEVFLINAGTVGVTIDRFTLTSSTADLSVRRPIPTPVSLPAGGLLSFEVAYAASDLGVDEGDVEIGVRGLGFSITVPLRGEGADNPRVRDTFEQDQNDKVDVLFVIDDSCSMRDDQAALANNFRSFIQQADVRQVDFQIGITTTTVFPFPGLLVGPILDRATPSLETAFQLQAAVGTAGSGIEQGLDAMQGVLTAADRGQSPQADLLRPDASRVVITVSDEDDQSRAAAPVYFNELRTRSPNGYTTAVVTGQSAGCQGATGSATPAPKYESFASLTGGLSESICSSWAQTLSSIGQAAFGLRSRFFLSRSADASEPIQVWVNGAPRASGWRYEPSDGSIVFDVPPAEGARVEVEYTPFC